MGEDDASACTLLSVITTLHAHLRIEWSAFNMNCCILAMQCCYTAQSVVQKSDINAPGKSPNVPGKKS